MLSQSDSMNTSIDSCRTHFLRQEESQSQSEKRHSVNEPLNLHGTICLGEIIGGTIGLEESVTRCISHYHQTSNCN